MIEYNKKTIGEIADTCLGKMLDEKKNRGVLKPYLANRNVRWGSFDLENLPLMRFEEGEEERYGLKNGDIVICEGGEPGRCAIWNGELPNIKIQKAIHRVRVHEEVNNYYLYYWLYWAGRNGILEPYMTGTTIKHLPGDRLRSIIIPLPNIKYQKRVSEILHKIDLKIKVNETINKNLEKQIDSAYSSIFIEDADPSWREGTISDLGTVVGGSTPSKKVAEYYTDNGIAWITPKDLSVDHSKFFYHGETDITELGLKNSSAVVMPEGTVLFSSRAPIGYIAIAANELCTNQGFKSVVPNDNIGTAFVYCFLKSNLPVIEGMASGSTFKEVSGSVMKSVPATIPDSESLRKFTDFSEPLLQEQKGLETENRKLSGIRDNLLLRLMSGELDVSNVEI